jgi:hypothetical protein
MKKLIQCVAALVVALLATQPALAGLACGLGSIDIACTPACPMAMSQMSGKCSMPQHAAGTGCLQECCRFGQQQAVARTTNAKPKSKVAETALFQQLPLADKASIGAVITPSALPLDTSPPPRYLVLRVFRI